MRDVGPRRSRRKAREYGKISYPLQTFRVAIPAILGVRLGGKSESTTDFRNFAGKIGFIDDRWLPGDPGKIMPSVSPIAVTPLVEYPNTFRFGNRSEEPLA